MIDEGALFDEDDDEDASEPTNFLVAPKRAETSDALNATEEDYRRQGMPPITFEDEDGNLENPGEMFAAMNLEKDAPLPTVADCDAWNASRWLEQWR